MLTLESLDARLKVLEAKAGPVKHNNPIINPSPSNSEVEQVVSLIVQGCAQRWPTFANYGSSASIGDIKSCLMYATVPVVASKILDMIALFGGNSFKALESEYAETIQVAQFFQDGTEVSGPSNDNATYTDDPNEIYKRATLGMTFAGNDTLPADGQDVELGRRLGLYLSMIKPPAPNGWGTSDHRTLYVLAMTNFAERVVNQLRQPRSGPFDQVVVIDPTPYLGTFEHVCKTTWKRPGS